MARHRGPVLVDTNVILECSRINAWRALTGGYGVETVEDCVIETQTGYQRRRPEQQIDQAALFNSLKAVHKVGDEERAAAMVRDPCTPSSIQASRRFGLTRCPEPTRGCFVVPTRRAFASVFGSDAATD